MLGSRRPISLCILAILTWTSIAASTPLQENDALARNAARVRALEARLPMGPTKAAALSLEIAWRTPISDQEIRSLYSSDDAVFLINSDNEITMYDITNGKRRWSSFGGGGSDIIIDVVHIPEAKKLLVVRTNSILTLSDQTGIPVINNASQSSVQAFDWLATTRGVLHGNSYIYGGLGGEIVWQGWDVGFSVKAHRLGLRVDNPPIIASSMVIAASRSGIVMALDASNGEAKWNQQLLGSMGGSPATGGGKVFISSHDQHLRSFDLKDGRLKWARLFDSPLTSGPALIDETIYQQVPGTGLVAMEANADNAPSGIIKWKASDVDGNVIGTVNGLLLVWNPETRTLRTLSASTGGVDATAAKLKISHLDQSGSKTILLGGQNELQCLQPASVR